MKKLNESDFIFTELEKEVLDIIWREVKETDNQDEYIKFYDCYFCINPFMGKEKNKKYRGALASLRKKNIIYIHGDDNCFIDLYYEL